MKQWQLPLTIAVPIIVPPNRMYGRCEFGFWQWICYKKW